MRILTVIDNPDPNSFTHAIAERFNDGAIQAGHTVEIADLYVENFDPRWQIADEAQFEDLPVPADVLAYQARIEKADVICMTFPLFWFGMPAMMKGWIDRVWSYGWAYDQIDDPEESLQRDRIGVMLIPAGGDPKKWEPYEWHDAMDAIWRKGTMGYFGMKDRRIHILNGSEGSEKRRASLLRRAFDAGAGLSQSSTQ
ncbi:MAG: NAD(P)H-dependent oxidoreductase [Pseudomonadota bacterium]